MLDRHRKHLRVLSASVVATLVAVLTLVASVLANADGPPFP